MRESSCRDTGSSLPARTVLAWISSVFRAAPRDVHTGRGDELDERLDIPDTGYVFQRDGVFGEQRGAHDRQRGVLVS